MTKENSPLHHERFFLDTNIVIYSFDKSAPKKQKKAQALLAEALSTGKGIISHQVIQEFVSVADSRFKGIFDHEHLVLYLDEVLFSLWKAYPDREIYLSALEVRKKYGLSWWDSLIVAAALSTDCRTLYSEDLQHGQSISTLRIMNPFVEAVA